MLGFLHFEITACFDVGASLQDSWSFKRLWPACACLHGACSGLARGSQSLDSVEHSWDQNYLELEKAIASAHQPHLSAAGPHTCLSSCSVCQLRGGFKLSFLNKHGVGILFFKLFLHANCRNSPVDLALADDHPCNSSNLVSRLGHGKSWAQADWGHYVQNSLLLKCFIFFLFPGSL